MTLGHHPVGTSEPLVPTGGPSGARAEFTEGASVAQLPTDLAAAGGQPAPAAAPTRQFNPMFDALAGRTPQRPQLRQGPPRDPRQEFVDALANSPNEIARAVAALIPKYQ